MTEEQARAIIHSATGLLVGEALNAIDVARDLATALTVAVAVLDGSLCTKPHYVNLLGDDSCQNRDHYELRA